MPSGSIQQSDQDSSVTSKTSASLAAAKSSKATCRNSIRSFGALREPRLRPRDRVLERIDRRDVGDPVGVPPREAAVAATDLQDLASLQLDEIEQRVGLVAFGVDADGHAHDPTGRRRGRRGPHAGGRGSYRSICASAVPITQPESRFSEGPVDADVVGVMASEQVPAGRERVSPRTQRLTESLGPRALRIGLRTTLLAPLAAAASVAILEGDGPGLGSFLPLFLGLVAVGVVVAFLPWDRLHGTPTGRRILLVWAVLDVLLITVAGRATGATDAALPLAYAVTFVFFAVVLMPGAQVAYLCFMLACYGVVTASTFEPLSFLMLAIVGIVSIFLARELRRRIAAHERARTGAERRWAVVGSVSSAARDAEPRRVLEGVVEAIVALGYETAAIHLPGEAGELQVVLPAAAAADPTLGIRTIPDSIRSEVLGKGRDVVARVKEVDRQAARGLRSSGIETVAGTPIVVGDRPEGILLVASTDPDGISSQEVEAFAMLATTAAMALSNARRAEERREVEERLTDAGAVRAEVLATLSTEVRKPLGAVTETSRALRDTFGNEDRRRLIERLVASATALDITLGGSLDLSLLESSGVELHNEDVDVGGLVSGVLTRLAVLFEGRDLRADVPTGLTVEADPGLMDQAVEHLLVTAAASTPPGKAVEVSVSRTGAETTVKVAIDTVDPRCAARADPRTARDGQRRRGPVDPPRARVEDPRAARERAADAERPQPRDEGVVPAPRRALDAAGAGPDRRGPRRSDGTPAAHVR